MAFKKHLLGLLFAVLTIIPMQSQTNIKNYNNTISGNGAPGLNLPCNIYNPGQLYDDQSTGKVYGCTNGVWLPSASTLPAGGNFAIQFANNEQLGGANFTGFVFNNGSSAPPSQASQAQAYALLGGTPAFVDLPNIFTKNNTSSANGAASQPVLTFNGLPFQNGTTTTTKPMILIEPTGLPSSGWDTHGTILGINVPPTPTFGGQIVDLQVNGASTFRLSSNGSLVSAGTATFNGIQAGPLLVTGEFTWGVTGAGSNPIYNVPLGVSVILVDASLFSVQVNLPTTPNGQEFIIKRIDGSANVVTVSGNGHTIDGVATQTITSQYGVLRISGSPGITAQWYLF